MCFVCDDTEEKRVWLCSHCSKKIGKDNIRNTINNMPNYLNNGQYMYWLKLTLERCMKRK